MKLGDMTIKQVKEYCKNTNCKDCPLYLGDCTVFSENGITDSDLNVEIIDKTRWQTHDYNDGLFICPNCGYEISADLPCSEGWIGCPKCLAELKL